jgi:hypothetical protein
LAKISFLAELIKAEKSTGNLIKKKIVAGIGVVLFKFSNKVTIISKENESYKTFSINPNRFINDSKTGTRFSSLD